MNVTYFRKNSVKKSNSSVFLQCKFLKLLWHNDWQVCWSAAFDRWKEEIPLLVSVMEENSFPADAGSWKRRAASTPNDFCRHDHSSRQRYSCTYLCLLLMPLESFLELTVLTM